MSNIREQEQQILLRIERRAEALRQANPAWSYEKAYAEALIGTPDLYAAYNDVRERAKQRGIRPIVRNKGGQ